MGFIGKKIILLRGINYLLVSFIERVSIANSSQISVIYLQVS